MAKTDFELTDILSFPSKPFAHRKKLSRCSCLYFVLAQEEVLYIGKTNDLRNRWGAHQRIVDLLDIEDAKIFWLEINDPVVLSDLETQFIRKFKPKFNRAAINKSKPDVESEVLNMNQKSLENLRLGRLPKGEEPLSKNSVTVRLPQKLDEFVRSKPNRTQWLTELIEAAYEREADRAATA